METTLNSTQAVFVLEEKPNDNYNNEDYFFVGMGSEADKKHYGLLQFDLSAYLGFIINSATLRLYSYDYWAWTYTTSQSAYRNTSSFDQTKVTFNLKPSYDVSTGTSMTNGGYNEWYEWNAKDIVQSWAYGAANYGFTVMQPVYQLERTKCYKRTGTYAPQLVLDYTPAGVYVNDDGTFKVGLVYANDGGTWKRGIVHGNNGAWKNSC